MALENKKAAVKKRAPRKVPIAALQEDEHQIMVEEPEIKKPWWKQYWHFLVMGVLALTLLLVLFWPSPKPPKPVADNTEVIRQKDSTIASLQREAAMLGEEKDLYKSIAEEILNRPIQNQKYYVESKKKLDEVPAVVRALDRRQLHNEITELTSPKDTP